MKKNIIACCILVLTMASFSTTEANQLDACEILAIEVHNNLQEAGLSHADAYHLSGIVQDWCERDLM